MRDQFGKVTADVQDGCPNLKLIVTRSSGYDHIDLDAARVRGIIVCNVPDYRAHMIAEHAFGLMLAVARNICRGSERCKQTQPGLVHRGASRPHYANHLGKCPYMDGG